MARTHTSMADLMRGVGGGTLLGVPLVYTQEVWMHGVTTHPFVILGLLVVTFGVTAALSHYVGFERSTKGNAFEEATVALGMSIVLAAGLLALLNRVAAGMSMQSIAGVTALATLPVSIGFAIGNALAPKGGGVGASEMTGTSADLFVAAGGTIVFVLNIAPTQEPILLARDLSVVHLLLVVAASLVLPYLIVFYAEFGGRDKRRASDGATQGPLVETLLAYVVSLVICAALLAAFGRLEALDAEGLAMIVVLAFPGSLGGALGRMLV